MTHKLMSALGALWILLAIPACSGSCTPGTVGRDAGGHDAGGHGALSATWAITVRGQTVTCALVGAASVAAVLHPHAGGDDLTLKLDCATSGATTAPAAVGAYDVTLALLAPDGTPIVTSPAQLDVVLGAGLVTPLAPVTFAVPDNHGQLVLSFAAVGQGANCLTPHGTPLSSHVLTMHFADGGCAEMTLTRARGATKLGEYTIDCTAPARMPCLEQDETLSVTGIGSGPYSIVVSGLAGPSICWIGEDGFSVPAGGTLTKRVQLGPLGGTGC